MQFTTVRCRPRRTDQGQRSGLNRSGRPGPKLLMRLGLLRSPWMRKPSGWRSDEDRRAISGPLTPVTSGLSRSLADTPPRRSDRITSPDGADSQADSAGSIPVTRSTTKAQFGSIFRTLGLRSSWGRIAPWAISVPLGAPSADCQLFRPTTPVLITRLRRTLAGRLRAIHPGALFGRGKRLLFEVKYGAERDVDLHELAGA